MCIPTKYHSHEAKGLTVLLQLHLYSRFHKSDPIDFIAQNIQVD